MKRVVIDGRTWSATGLGTYVQNLCREIDGNLEFEFYLLVNKKDFHQVPNFESIKKFAVDVQLYSVKEQLFYKKIITNFKPDLVHFTHFNVPVNYNAPYVVTFHDLISLSFPSRYSNTFKQLKYKFKDKIQKPVMRHAVQKAKKIITPTKYVANQVFKYFPEAKDKLSPIYLGPGNIYVVGKDLPQDIISPYILNVGIFFRHKNLATLIKSFEIVHKSLPEMKLVLVGSGPEEKYLKDLAEQKHLPVIFTGRLSETELGAVYKNASALVFPSLSEGFGLPPLEAMQNGIVVVSSNATCLPEVLGDAAAYFNPTDMHDMAKTIIETVKNDGMREEFILKGLEQVKKYSWSKMSEETLAVYREALN